MVAGEGGLIFFEVIPLGFTKVYLFDLILYILANDFSIVFGWVFLGCPVP